ncbi:MAG: hypothetical protein QXW41_08000 [Fervidicoccaceae archaeon]|uniref:Uncharacterized protein n=1 Tax=Pyrobaculum arsenaticum (strain DSM 13514 / JCM 11321 / PZ6) TaxID=340102 RepID=A4WJD1_PYRAR|nr:conserved hypothetical protein [Pyrobaculum arsenaticum DSM 13514]
MSGLLGIALFNVGFIYLPKLDVRSRRPLIRSTRIPLTSALTALSSKRWPPPGVALGSALSAAGAYFILQPYIQGNSLAGPAQALATTTSW